MQKINYYNLTSFNIPHNCGLYAARRLGEGVRASMVMRIISHSKLNKMGKQRLVSYTCDGATIEEFVANYSDDGLPKKGGTFSLQKNVSGEIKSLRYLVEAVFVSEDRVQCDCSFIGYSA